MAKPAFQGAVMTNAISSSELNHRVAVLKRFKELLKAQRDRFQAYLNALDKQKDVIQSGTTDELLQYVELEEKIVTDIFSIQKVIDPLEEMYRSTRMDNLGLKSVGLKPAGLKSGLESGPKSDSGEVASLKEALNNLKAEAVVRSERNRELLTKRMAELRSEIKSLKNQYPRRRPDNSQTPSFIDLKG